MSEKFVAPLRPLENISPALLVGFENAKTDPENDPKRVPKVSSPSSAAKRKITARLCRGGHANN